MSEDVSVRPASTQDAAAVAELMTGLNFAVGVTGVRPGTGKLPENAVFSPELIERRMLAMDQVETCFLAESDGRAIGFMSLRLVPYMDQDVPYAEVMNLFVRPEVRRLGVARELIATAERVARERGATVIHILTAADNLQAQAFYRAVGYEMPDVSFEKYLSAGLQEVAR